MYSMFGFAGTGGEGGSLWSQAISDKGEGGLANFFFFLTSEGGGFSKLLTFLTHSSFRGSVNYGAHSMENRFQVAKFVFEVRKASSLFCLVQNGPGFTWVACIGLRERFMWSLGWVMALLEAFWTFCNTYDTQSQAAARMEF